MSYLDNMLKVVHTPLSVVNMLGFVDATDRDLWVKCGQAVHSELGNDGFEIFDNWKPQAITMQKPLKTRGEVLRLGVA